MLAVLDEADSLNRNYLPVTGDSLLKEAARWFDSHGSANERVRAHYLLGCAYRDKGEAPAALQCYHDAVDCADTTASDCDYRLLSRVHGQMGYLFYQEYLPQEQLNALNKAIHYSRLSKDTLSAIKFYEFSASAYELSHNEDSMLSIYNKAIEEYSKNGYAEESYRCYEPLIDLLIDRDSLTLAYDYIKKYKKKVENPSLLFNYIEGKYYLMAGQISTSLPLFYTVLVNAEDLNDSLLAYQGLYKAYKNTTQQDSAMYCADKYYWATSCVVERSEAKNLQQLNSAYNYSRHQQIAIDKAKESALTKTILFICIIVFTIFANGMFYIIRKRKKERAELELQHENDVQELFKTRKEIDCLVNEKIPSMISEKTNRIHELQAKIEEYQSIYLHKRKNADKRLLESDVCQHFRNICKDPSKNRIDETDWIKIKNLLAETIPHFFQFLTLNTSSLREIEIRLCVLVRLYFKPKEISVILQISQSEVSVLRSRLFMKIYGENGSAKEFDKRIQSISD